MQNFTQYKLDDFYEKHYWEGGLHLFQVQKMYEFVIEQKNTDYKFFAAIQGIDLDKAVNKEKSQSEKFDEMEKKQEIPIFRDPSEYEGYSQEELDKMTKNMKQSHSAWAEKAL